MVSYPHSIIYIVDDDEIILWMYREYLSGIGADIRTFSSATAFLDSYTPSPIEECLICDLRMPTLGGEEVQRRLIEKGVELPIIFVSSYGEIRIAVNLVKNGAFDFLEKPVNGNVLVQTVQRALSYSREQKKKLAASNAINARMALLTPREKQIVKMVVDGKSNQDIAEELAISLRTVENHRARIMDKLHVNSSVALVKLFI